jgi:hypothetical protein
VNNKKKILMALLGSVCVTPYGVYGDNLDGFGDSNKFKEGIHTQSIEEFNQQRFATNAAVLEILSRNAIYKTKSEGERNIFAAMFTAITWSSPEAHSNLTLATGSSQNPKLVQKVIDLLEKTITVALRGDDAQSIVRDIQSGSENLLLYKRLVKPIKSNNALTLLPFSDSATATDAAGNAATVTLPITIDTVVNPFAINAIPTPTNNTTPTISGTVEAGSTVSVEINGQTINATINGTNWTATPISALTHGDYTVTATAMDAAGNVSAPVTLTPNLTVMPVTSITNVLTANSPSYNAIGGLNNHVFSLIEFTCTENPATNFTFKYNWKNIGGGPEITSTTADITSAPLVSTNRTYTQLHAPFIGSESSVQSEVEASWAGVVIPDGQYSVVDIIPVNTVGTINTTPYVTNANVESFSPGLTHIFGWITAPRTCVVNTGLMYTRAIYVAPGSTMTLYLFDQLNATESSGITFGTINVTINNYIFFVGGFSFVAQSRVKLGNRYAYAARFKAPTNNAISRVSFSNSGTYLSADGTNTPWIFTTIGSPPTISK